MAVETARSAPKGRVDLRMAVFSRGHASMRAGIDFSEAVLRATRRSLDV